MTIKKSWHQGQNKGPNNLGVVVGEGLGTKNGIIVNVVFTRVVGNFLGKFSKGN